MPISTEMVKAAETAYKAAAADGGVSDAQRMKLALEAVLAQATSRPAPADAQPDVAERLAFAADDGARAALAGVHELYVHEDGCAGLPPDSVLQEGDKPLCRFVWTSDSGDMSAGIQPRAYWALADDQSGTVLSDFSGPIHGSGRAGSHSLCTTLREIHGRARRVLANHHAYPSVIRRLVDEFFSTKQARRVHVRVLWANRHALRARRAAQRTATTTQGRVRAGNAAVRKALNGEGVHAFSYHLAGWASTRQVLSQQAAILRGLFYLLDAGEAELQAAYEFYEALARNVEPAERNTPLNNAALPAAAEILCWRLLAAI
ncbi:hypothetical protein F6X40_35365 [Paraburkholderia sp. UCT31]|uniref:hypothetical protein n=1 Tax=Paraburkholderia sp. UCT31 TaxID=2615209 RepID=UPI001654E1EB|nr:hypothetical protein [Paraburkholderia sp. UCT31]MBC8741830.1 hypothetical protein [Paraburkholderia sp. UCT31]